MKLVMMLAVLGAVSLSACVTVGDEGDEGDDSQTTATDNAKNTPGVHDEGGDHLTDKPPVVTPPGTCEFQCGGSRFVHAVNLGGYCREVGVHGEGVCWAPDHGGRCWTCP